MYGLVKIAASFDARRNKQYWQLLKRLYGGTDEAVDAIRSSGDTGIWHGTRANLAQDIDSSGLQPGPFREFGKGTFFGDKGTADLYAETKVMSSYGSGLGSVYDAETKTHITDPKEIVEFFRSRPESAKEQFPKYKISEGSLFRLAKPSELRGTKTLYPDIQKAKVFDVNKPDDLKGVASSQTAYMNEHDVGVKRAISILGQKVKNGSDAEAKAIAEAAARKHMDNNSWLYENKTPEELEDKFRNTTEEFIKGVRNPEKDPHAAYQFQLRLGEILADKVMTTRNEREMNQLRSYGKLRGRRVFERLNPDEIRREFFFDKEPVPPELLRYEDGRALNGPLRETVETPGEKPPLFNK